MTIKTENPIDRNVGTRIRMQRMLLGLSQAEVGKAVGVTFQQVQKYEKGRNRIGASRLQQIANVLKVTPDFFFDGESSPNAVSTSGSRETAIIEGFISSRDGLALSKAHQRRQDAAKYRIVG
jgi:transcriptional regulator with XRE-family HTH domain